MGITSGETGIAGREDIAVVSETGVVQLAIDCVQANAGTPQAVFDFREAQAGRIVSFTDRSIFPANHQSWIRHIPTGQTRISRLFHIPPRLELRAAVADLTRTRLIVIHGLYRFHVQWGVKVARELRVPYWLVPHGGLDPYVFTYRSLRKRIWFELIGKKALQGAERVLVATKLEATKAASHLRYCTINVVPLPVRAWSNGRNEVTRSAARERLGIPQTARALLFLGRLHPMKRIRETIDAVAAARHADVHLIVVGPGTAEFSVDNCRAYAERRGFRRAHIVGPAFGAERDQWMSASDGFISLSYRENFGYAAAESLAHGLPVILSPGNDLSAEIAPISPGWLLRSLSDDEVIRAIRQFGDSSHMRLRAMGTAGSEWARRELSTETFAARLRNLRTAGIDQR